MTTCKSGGDSLFGTTLFVFSKEPELCDCINNVHNIIKGVSGHLDYRTVRRRIARTPQNCKCKRAQEALNLIKTDIVSPGSNVMMNGSF